MNTKLKQLAKIIFISLILIFIGCEKDVLNEHETHNHSNEKGPNEVSLDFFRKATNIDNVDAFLKNKMNKNRENYRVSNATLFDFSIDTTLINQCDLNNGASSFSFRIYPINETELPNEIYNLVILLVDNQWETSIFLLTKNTDTSLDKKFASIEEIYKSIGLPTGIMGRYISGFLETTTYHCTNTGKCTGGTCDLCKLCITTTIEYVSVFTPEENDNLSFQDPAFVFNGGDGGSNIPLEVSTLNQLLSSLSISQQYWWDNVANRTTKVKIIDYLNQNTTNNIINPRAEQFVIELIDDMINFPFPEGEDNGDEFDYNDYSNILTTAQTLPGRNSFYSHFPKVGSNGMPSSQVYQLVGGHPYQAHIAGNSNYQNACALRVSRALNYSGNPISVFKNNNNEQKTEKGDDNLNYILDASSLLAYMKKTFPNSTPVHLINKTPTEIKTALNGKWGIYIMIPKNRATFGASGHADFWSNTGCLSGCYFEKAKEVYFWELF